MVELIALIENKTGIGTKLSEGVARSAKKWERLEEDLETGFLPLHIGDTRSITMHGLKQNGDMEAFWATGTAMSMTSTSLVTGFLLWRH